MKKIIFLSILFLSFSIYSQTLLYYDIKLGTSKQKLFKLLEDPGYTPIEAFPNNWIQFGHTPKQIIYKCKLEKGVVSEFTALQGGKGNSKTMYEYEFKEMHKYYGDPIRMGFRRSLWKIKNQFLQLLVNDNPDAPGYIVVAITHTSTIDSDHIIKGKDMCLDNLSSLYNLCED